MSHLAGAAPTVDLGVLAGAPGEGDDFLRSFFEPETESLRLDRRGVFWEAVGAARLAAVDRLPDRRLIAVIDSGFDLGITRLAAVAHPASRPGPGGAHGDRHGSAVALLINEIAPDATLLLIDVMPDGTLPKQRVADAVTLAGSCGADIVNLSLEFRSSATPRQLAAAPGRSETAGALVADVERFFAAVEGYSSDGCLRTCALCDAVRALPASAVVFAASGNWPTYACPACVPRVVSAALIDEHIGDGDGGVVSGQMVDADLPPNLTWEASVPRPPGLTQTSFAAPLLAGLAAIVDEPQVLADVALLPFAHTPVAAFANELRRRRSVDAADLAAWAAGLAAVGQHCPPPHRHWEHADDTRLAPCPVCAFGMVNILHEMTVLQLVAGDLVAATRMAAIAAAISPLSPSANGNLAEAHLRAARRVGPGRARTAHAEAAHRAASTAARLAPHVRDYAAKRAAAESLLSC